MVHFDALKLSFHNLELKGDGQLVMQSGEALFQFTGKSRILFSQKEKSLAFTPIDIWNAVQNGARLSFSTGLGNCGKQGKRFEFLCANDAEAAEIFALLPTRVDSEFTAEQDFVTRLRQLPGSASPLTSVTGLIVATNVIVFAVMAGFFDAGWIEVNSMTAYIRLGANNGAATTDGEWWRLLTSAFMHFGLLHLALNMWALVNVGGLLERLLGRSVFLFLYLACGIGGSLASIGWHGDKMWSAGASGAVFGICGGLLGYSLRLRQVMPRAVWKPLQTSALTFAGYNLLYGLANPGIDNAAHIGGLLTGVTLGWLIAVPVDLERRPALIRKNLRLGLAVAAVGIALGVTATPRFDYRVQEEIEWEGVVKGYGEKETALIQHDQEARKLAWKDDASRAKYVKWLGDEMMPFWDSWASRLAGLHYTPDRRTERRRVVLLQYFHVQSDAIRHLRAGVEKDDPEEIKIYNSLSKQAGQLIRSLSP